MTASQIRHDDPFGRMMVRNLFERRCPLLGIVACSTPEAQVLRALSGGWSRAEAIDMLQFYDSVFAPEERRQQQHLGNTTVARTPPRIIQLLPWRARYTGYTAVTPRITRPSLYGAIETPRRWALRPWWAVRCSMCIDRPWTLDCGRRRSKLELLDEVEEFQMLLRHYCILVAVSDKHPSCSTADDACDSSTAAADALFSSVSLTKPLTGPPLEALIAAVKLAAQVEVPGEKGVASDYEARREESTRSGASKLEMMAPLEEDEEEGGEEKEEGEEGEDEGERGDQTHQVRGLRQ